MTYRKGETGAEWWSRQSDDFKKSRARYNDKWSKEHRVGFRGTYRGRMFMYKVKLPKGAHRHHVVYNDSDPNYGIIFVTPEYHKEIHGRNELGEFE